MTTDTRVCVCATGQADKDMINAALAHWASETCLTFELVSTTATVTEQHLLFTTEAG